MNYRQLVDERREELNRWIHTNVMGRPTEPGEIGIYDFVVPDYFTPDGAEMVRQKVAGWVENRFAEFHKAGRFSDVILEQERGNTGYVALDIEPWIIVLAAALATGFGVEEEKVQRD